MIVNDLFTLNDDFKNFKLLVGKNGLCKEIKKVEIMEVPDGVFWAKENSIIITTGYSLKKNDITTSSLIQMLIEKKVSALGIKLGRYIDEIPQSVLDYAEKNDFPIINIPLNMCYDELVEPINQKLMDSDSYEIFILKQVKKELRNIIKHNYNLESIMNLMMSYIGKPAAIVWMNDFNFIAGNMFECFAELSEKLKENIKAIYEIEGQNKIKVIENNFIIFKIETANTLQALLCIEETDNNIISDIDYEIIYEFIPAITIYLLSNTELSLQRNKSCEDLYFKSLLGEYKNNKLELNKDAYFSNVAIEKSRFCIIIKSIGNVNIDKINQKALNIFRNNENTFYIKSIYNRLVIICEISKSITSSRHFENILISYYKELLRAFPEINLYIGISNVCNSLYNLHCTYAEADFALKIGERLNKDKILFFYEDYMIYHLLSEILSHPTIARIYRNTIERIKKYDETYEQEYLKTIYGLIENDYSIGQASKALFIHRNTLYKRIEKINSILNFDITNAENRLLIHIALKIDQMLS